MDKAVGVGLIILAVASGLLFLAHALQLISNMLPWISDGDWLSLFKRILTTFLFAAVAWKAFVSGKTRFKG